MKALIVDSEELFRLSLREVVAVSGNFTDIIEAASEHDFLAKTASHTTLNLIILHPGNLQHEGEDWVRLVRRLYPGTPVITITNDPHMAGTHWMGTIAIARSASANMMVTTIRRALRVPQDAEQKPATPARPNIVLAAGNEFSQFQDSLHPESNNSRVDLKRLSYRQKQILAMAADGLPNKEIAARLGIAEGTVKAHMHAIFKVLGVSNRTQAVIRYGAASQTVSPSQMMPSNGSAAQRAHLRSEL